MIELALSGVLALGLALRGLRKGSLSPSGAAAAFLVGFAHMAIGFEFGATLIAFYLSSSKLTKWRSDLKARLEAGHKLGGRRGASQVLANSLLGAALAATAAWLRHSAWATPGTAGSLLGSCSAPSLSVAAACSFVGFYACCCGDTWSSELGIAARAPPRLITTGRRVPPGTNGGVSLLGAAAAAAGGALMGCVFCGAAWLATSLSTHSADAGAGVDAGGSSAGAGWRQAAADWRLVALACAAGLAGSLLDSLLGATLQWSGFDERTGKAVSGRPAAGAGAAGAGAAPGRCIKHTCGRDVLSNTGVNVVSSTVVSALAGALGMRLLAASCAAPS